MVNSSNLAPNNTLDGRFGEVWEVRVIIRNRNEDEDEVVLVKLLPNSTRQPIAWGKRRRELSARVGDMVVVIDHLDRF